jgi:hypothetical protein
MTSVQNLVQRLKAQRSGQGWKAKCPAHDDQTPSLSINEGADGRALIKCHGGCSPDAVLSAAGMFLSDLFPAPIKTAQAAPVKATPVVQPRPLGELLDGVCKILRRYVVFQSREQAEAVALWVAHTWALEAFDYTPILAVHSAEKRSGKTRLLDVLALVVKGPWRAAGASEAVLFRKVDRDKPTLLYDEVDTVFHAKKNDGMENIRRFFNVGYERGAKIPRCVGEGTKQDIQEFDTFCPKATSGIDKVLPDTVADRSIPIELERQSREDKAERFRRREAEEVIRDTREGLEAWAQPDVIEALRAARPVLPEELTDRQQDICEPLLAIAEMAGGRWPGRGRDALVKLCAQEEDASRGVTLLDAIRGVFDKTEEEKLTTKTLLEELIRRDDGPWALMFEDALKHDKLNSAASRLARMLKPYKIKTHTIRLTETETGRGYYRSDFAKSWELYLTASTSPPREGITPNTPNTYEGKNVLPSTDVLPCGEKTNTGSHEGKTGNVLPVIPVLPSPGGGETEPVVALGAMLFPSDDPVWFKYKPELGRYAGESEHRETIRYIPFPDSPKCELCGTTQSPFWWYHRLRRVAHCKDCFFNELFGVYDLDVWITQEGYEDYIPGEKWELPAEPSERLKRWERWLHAREERDWSEKEKAEFGALEAELLAFKPAFPKKELEANGMTAGQFLAEATALFNAVPVNEPR